MPERLTIAKTYKLYINGAFPRTESGRSLPVKGNDGEVLAHLCHASRKDLRDAVEAALTGRKKWWGATAYNRGQVIYRMAEMLEGKRDDMVAHLAATMSGGVRAARREVDAAIDRLVCFSGWTDKFTQTLGCQNPVAGPYYNFTTPEPSGVVAVICPDDPPLLGLVSMLCPPLCAGNAVIVIASDKHPLTAAIFGEVCATSDVPAGAVNILTGRRSELLPHIASHRAINAVWAINLSPTRAQELRAGRAENIKRVRVERRKGDTWYDTDECESPWTIEPFVEMKTIWHPSAM